MSQALNRLQDLLGELFQLDTAVDLDFGIYRIMNHKRDEINGFIENSLPEIVENALSKGSAARQTELADELREKAEQVQQNFGDDAISPDGDLLAFQNTPLGREYRELKERTEGTTDLEGMKAIVFNHLYTFFSRYYEGGDFLSKRRYSRQQKYAIPYNGEEVYLHWANADQYYIKTGEHFTNYQFTVNDVKVNFKLVAADVEKNNNKGKDRYFLPRPDQAEYDKDESLITIPFEHRPLTDKEESRYGAKNGRQKNINEEAVPELLARFNDNPEAARALEREKPKGSNNQPVSYLQHHLNRYTARNNSDFFINKDLKGFLQGELDFYLKNEVLNIDDLDSDRWGEERAESWFEVMQAMKRIGREIIAFLAQIEDYQKKLFEKKKFVTAAEYCLTLDRVPEELYSEILDNEDQIAEWEDLFKISEIEDTVLNGGGGLSIQWLKDNLYLLLDTRFFDQDFKDRLLSSIEDLDEKTDGLLINSENFQALNLLQDRYRESVECVYLDPPYNTGNDEFIYKDSYQHSSWLAMMEDRLSVARSKLNDEGVIFVSVDENEVVNLGNLLSKTFSEVNHVENIAWNKRVPKNDKGIGNIHEYVFVFAKDAALRRSKDLRFQVYKTGIEKIRELISTARSRQWSSAKATEELRKLYEKETFDRGITLYNEVNDDYQVWGKINLNWPSPRSEGPKYTLLHPVSGKPVRIPKRGWRWKRETLEQHLGEEIRPLEDGSFISGNIWFGADEKTQPSFIQYLDDVEFQLLRSIISLKSSGGLDLEDLGLQSGALYPKPVSLIAELVFSEGHSNGTVLDHFAGSGTTGHAVIDLNREDNGKRNYLLVEMGEYFGTVLKPRIQKVIYSKDWKDGKPENRNTGVSHMFKYLSLEQYEDTLNNISFGGQARGQQAMELYGDDYLLRYMLDFETRDSETLLNVRRMESPFNYNLTLYDGEATRQMPVDLPETFNYLLGMRVKSRKAYHDSGRRYLVYRGETEEAGETVVIWRDTGGWSEEDYRRDEAFVRENELTAGAEEVFINGDSFIPEARPLEPIFKQRMLAEPLNA